MHCNQKRNCRFRNEELESGYAQETSTSTQALTSPPDCLVSIMTYKQIHSLIHSDQGILQLPERAERVCLAEHSDMEGTQPVYETS